MLQREIVFFGRPVTLACDGRCDKAWGINGRPRTALSADPDDHVFIGDSELGTAPPPGETVGLSEGGHMKPSATALDAADSDQLNKWCTRECERSVLTKPGEAVVLPNMARPRPNIPRRAGDEVDRG